MTKKLISLIVVLCLLLSVLITGCEKETLTYNDFTYSVTGNHVTIESYNGEDTELTIPDEIDGKKVTSIGEKAFTEKTNLTKVTLPDTITEINSSAFFSCTRLKEINLPESLKIIGNSAFYECSSLESISIPPSLEDLEGYTFGKCINLKNVEINSKEIDTIPTMCFYYCTSLEEITLPDNIDTIQDQAFLSCYNLSKINFPKHLDSIGSYAFDFHFEGQGNPPQTPDRGAFNVSVENLEDYSLKCSGFSPITLVDTKKIGYAAFEQCQIEELSIPETVTYLEYGFHSKNYNLKNITVDKNNKNYESIDGAVYLKDNGKTLIAFPTMLEEKSYTLNENIRTLSPYSLSSTNMALELIVPETVTKIEKHTFSEANIQNVTINANIKEIKENTFEFAQINNLYLNDEIEVIKKDAFLSFNGASIHLPTKLKDIKRKAFTFCSNELVFTLDKNAKDFKLIDNSIYTSNEKELVLCGPSVNTEFTAINTLKKIRSYAFANNDIATINLNEGLEIIEDNAILQRNSVDTFKSIRVPDSVIFIGENNFGYVYQMQNGFLGGYLTSADRCNSFEIYGSENSIAEKYADSLGFAFFTDVPNQSIEEVTLKSGDTAEFTISNLGNIKPIYTSSDKDIATIDENGIITGIAKGTTYVTAAVNCKYFICKVTVTTGEYKNTDPYKDYLRVDYSNLEKFESDYFTFNKYKKDGSDMAVEDFSSIRHYTGSDYPVYNAILLDNIDSDKILLDYNGNIDQYYTYVENLPTETNRVNLNTDLVVYSGASDVDEYTKTDSSLKSMNEAIGNEVTIKNVISASVLHDVCTSFGGGPNRTLLEFYVPKDVNEGAYIKNISINPQESEYFFNQNVKFKIIDAGVRVVKIQDGSIENEKLETERYMKLEVVK